MASERSHQYTSANVEGERKNSLLFLERLPTLATKVYPNAKRIHLILDNYGIHDNLQVRLAMKSAAAETLELHFLPPYCPDHNRIERIWKDLHDNVTRNHRCTTMDELMAEVRSYLAARNQLGRHAYARTKVA
jgi:transposase